MKKRLLALALIAAMVLTGCGGGGGGETAAPAETQQGATETQQGAETTTDDRQMVIGIPKLAPTFNFFECINGYETYSFASVYDLLIAKDGTGYIPWLAESWEISDDAKVYTFHLNPKATWSDGTPVTSEDVQFSLENLKTSNYVSYIYEPMLDTIECPDAQTCVVTLKSGNVSFIEYLSNPFYCSILSKAAYEKYGADYGMSAEAIVGSGPYVVDEWKVGEYITYHAREDYYMGDPSVKNVKLVYLADSTGAMMAIQTGEIDVYFDDVPGISFATMEADPNVEVVSWPSTIQYDVFFNIPDSMFSDPNMRKAVAMAINKEDFVTVGVEGFGITAGYPCDREGQTTGDPKIHELWDQTYPNDIEAAKKLVEEAGYAGAECVINTYPEDPYPALATVLLDALTKIGLNARVEQLERATLSQKCIAECDFQIMLIRWAAATEDMDEFIYAGLHSEGMGSPGNWSWYSNPKMDELIVKAQAETDPAAREAIYKEVIEIFVEDCVFISLYYPTSSRAVGSRVQLQEGCGKFDKFYYYSWK